MAGGVAVPPGAAQRYPGRTTPFVVLVCFVAASGGALFGYDLGVTGGIVSMQGFLEQFFPSVWQQVLLEQGSSGGDPYCQYNNQGLQWFVSSLFIGGFMSCIPAGWMTRRYGRKFAMLTSGILFDIGVVLITAAWSLWVLILARVLLGIAIAFASISIILYNSEMAPAHIRGRLNILYQLILSLGVLVAQAINIGTAKIYPWGWRLSMALSGIPAIVLTLGGLLLPDTPNSLMERGKPDEAHRVLVKVRGTDNVEEELNDIKMAVKEAALVINPYRTILKRAYLPQLLIPITVQLFHQFIGINSVTFFAPQLFESLGMKQQTALIATVIIGAVNHLAVYFSVWAVDVFGRRFLFMEGGIQMMLSLVVLAAVVANAGQHLWVAWFTLVFLCSYTASFNWSWAPVGWLYVSETQYLSTRAAGSSISSFVYLLFAFVIGQTYLTILCAFRWGVFVFFAGWCLLATIVTYLFFPETKGLAIEDAPHVFKQHWFWRRFALLPVADHNRSQQLMNLPSLSAEDLEQARWQQHDTAAERSFQGGMNRTTDQENVASNGFIVGQSNHAKTQKAPGTVESSPVRHAAPRHEKASEGQDMELTALGRQPASDDPHWH